MKSKIMMAVIVAMFAATGLIAVVEDASADDSKVTYHIYLQLRDDSTGLKPVNIWLKPYEADEMSGISIYRALEEGCEAAGINYLGEGIPIIAGYKGHTELSHTYAYMVYIADNDKWAPYTGHEEATTYAFVFDEVLSSSAYEALSETEKAKYYYNYLMIGTVGGVATKLPATSTTGYENTMTYVILAIVMVILTSTLVIFLLRKRR